MAKKQQIKTDNLVVKSNRIIEAKYKLGPREQKFILFMVSKLNENDANFRFMTVGVAEIEAVLNPQDSNWGNMYDMVKDIVLSLSKKPLQIDLESGKRLIANWIASATLRQGEGIVEFEFSDRLRPYLLQLKSHFTRYKLQNILYLRSSFSIRLYELLKAHQFIGRVDYDLKHLKALLGLEDKYPIYYDFKRRVLLPAQKELGLHSDICFEFLEVAIKNRTEKIIFTIEENRRVVDQVPEEEIPEVADGELLAALMDFGLSKLKAAELLDLGFEALANSDIKKRVESSHSSPEEYFKYKLELTKFESQRHNLSNPVGFFLKAIQEDYQNRAFDMMQARKEKAEAKKAEKKVQKSGLSLREQQQQLYNNQQQLYLQQQQVLVEQLRQFHREEFDQLFAQQGLSWEDYLHKAPIKAKMNVLLAKRFVEQFRILKPMEESLQMLRKQLL